MATHDLVVRIELCLFLICVYFAPPIIAVLGYRAARVSALRADFPGNMDESKTGFLVILAAGTATLLAAGMYSLPPHFLSGFVVVPLFLLLAGFLLAPCGALMLLYYGRGWMRLAGAGAGVVAMLAAALTLLGGMAGAGG